MPLRSGWRGSLVLLPDLLAGLLPLLARERLGEAEHAIPDRPVLERHLVPPYRLDVGIDRPSCGLQRAHAPVRIPGIGEREVDDLLRLPLLDHDAVLLVAVGGDELGARGDRLDA